VVEFAPESITQLLGAWAPSGRDCNKLFQRKGRALTYRQPIDQFAQAAIVEPQRIRLPSATCQLDSAASDGGSLKLIAECADIISYTSRTVYVKLRSDDARLQPYRRSGSCHQPEKVSAMIATLRNEHGAWTA
jgi:hypothetical protein